MNWQKIGGQIEEFYLKASFCIFAQQNQPSHLKVMITQRWKKGKKIYHAKMLEAVTPQYLQKLLQTAELDNGGGNWVRGSLHPLFIDLQSADICDCVDKWHKFLGGKISIS